jgi:ubiquinone/menaquinone biosynthesis C-methylase UbiE
MDATDFKRASQAVWEAMAPGWDRRHAYFEETARPVTELMLERLAAARGETILELASGTGVVGFAAAGLVGSGGRIISSDFAEAMVEAAKRHARELGLKNVDCIRLDAERLDLPDESVDGVLCRWGYMLMGNPPAAFAEARRVLRRGGRLSCAVFAGPDQNPWVALPTRVLWERGHTPPPGAGAPGILALADRDRLRRLFTGAGFEDPQIDEVAFTWYFSDVDDYWDFLSGAAGAIAMILARLEADELRLVREQIGQLVASFVVAGRLELPATSLVASAVIARMAPNSSPRRA